METSKCILQNVLHDNVDATSPIIKKSTRPKKNVELLQITYHNYIKNALEMNKYKIPQLKEFLKNNKQRFSGKKAALIDRIVVYFKKTKSAIKIQSTYRKWLVIQINILRGPAFKRRDICVNNTDFCTLEPIDEISNDEFYSMTDSHNKTYGFNIASIMQYMMKKPNNVINPYNRDLLDAKTKYNIITLYNCCHLTIPLFKCNNVQYKPSNVIRNPVQLQVRSHQMVNDIIYNPRINRINSDEQLTVYNNIQSIRNCPNVQRIEHLFNAIDQLGNYANSRWFSGLDIRNYVRLYRAFYDIWNYRSGMSHEVRSNISPFCNPFDGIFNQRVMLSDLSLNQMQSACLIVFENAIYSGIDEDYRKLGAFHVLSALTLVSRGAREAMPWLYESVMH